MCVCVFVLCWARLSEVVILSADDGVCIFVLLIVYRYLAQGATGGWVILGLVFKCFICEFLLFDTP